MDGILRCTRYAFGPNRLHYCGPDANKEMLAYMQAGVVDPGLSAMLKGFRTMYPYLRLIANANGITDPMDDRVVEAYWIGNALLDAVGKRNLHAHLIDGVPVKKRVGIRDFTKIEDAIAAGALPHHSFHVLSVWRRTGHNDIAHTIESLDACRISWGPVVAVDGPDITVEREPLIEVAGRLMFGRPERVIVRRQLDAREDIERIIPGQIVTMHWGVPCEVVSPAQRDRLRRCTERHVALVNAHVRV